jgi:hypothetical protein
MLEFGSSDRNQKDGDDLINPTGFALARLQCGSVEKKVNGKSVFEKKAFKTHFQQVRSKPHAHWGQ